MERRKFIRTFMRWTFAAGLVTVGGTLIHRNQNGDGEKCLELLACDGCRLYAGCKRTRKENWLKNGENI